MGTHIFLSRSGRALIKNGAGSKTLPVMAPFLIPKTARLNTTAFRLGISAVFVIFLLIVLSFFISCTALPAEKTGRVIFINVEHGDAILIQIPQPAGNFNVLIDSGHPSARPLLNKAIQRYGAEQIDIAIATHSDEDHIGNFAELGRKIAIKRLIDNGIPYPEKSDVYTEYDRFKKTIDTQTLTNDVNLSVWDYPLEDYRFEIIVPHQKFGISANNDENSLVVRMVTPGKTFLFLADCTFRCEQELASRNVSADIIKLAHHGSNEGNSRELLGHIDPQLAIISSGDPFFDVHPSPLTLDVLRDLGIQYQVTHSVGDIAEEFEL